MKWQIVWKESLEFNVWLLKKESAPEFRGRVANSVLKNAHSQSWKCQNSAVSYRPTVSIPPKS